MRLDLVVAARVLLTALLVAAWFGATNHCALATPGTSLQLRESEAMPDDCPMHAAQKSRLPAQPNDCADLPCCKIVTPAAPASTKFVARPLWTGSFVVFFAGNFDDFVASASTDLPLVCDTGPPGENNFAESVLQQSLRAHAPPYSLS